MDDDRSSAGEWDEGALDVTDVGYVLLTLVVFGLLALVARGVERL